MMMVEVTWDDASDHTDTWVGDADTNDFADSPCRVISIGYLVKKTPKYVTLGGDWIQTDKVWGRMTKIPLGMIVEMVTLVPQPSPTEPAAQ